MCLTANPLFYEQPISREDRPLLFPLRTAVAFPSRLRIRFAVRCLRASADGGTLEWHAGDPAEAGIDVPVRAVVTGKLIASLAVVETGSLRLRVFSEDPAALAVRIEPGARAASAPASLADAIRAACGDEPTAAEFAGRACTAAPEAAREQAEAALARLAETVDAATPLLDCTFADTPEGLEAYRKALAGELPAAGRTPLTDVLAAPVTVELHLPFPDRKEHPSLSDALASAEVEVAGGRLFAGTGDGLEQHAYQATAAIAGPLLFPNAAQPDLVFADRRSGRTDYLARGLASILQAYDFGEDASDWLDRVSATGAELESRLTLNLPGTLAAAWFRAPGERDADFFDVYSKISVRMQQTMRRWLPLAFFSDPEAYEDVTAAFPLMFYQTTRPYAGRPRSDFSYDLVSPDHPGVARPAAVRAFAAEMSRVYHVLLAEGREKLAKSYSSWQAPQVMAGIVRQPRRINALLTADGFFIDQFVRLGQSCRPIAAQLADDPRRATRELTTLTTELATLLHRRLRRLYEGRDLTAFGPLLLIEATAALNRGTQIAATLRLRAEGRERTFLNAAAVEG